MTTRVLSKVESWKGALWPAVMIFGIDEPEVMYRGNAHLEAMDAGIPNCLGMHPDDPSGCVACAVEDLAVVMVEVKPPSPSLSDHRSPWQRHIDQERFNEGMGLS
jgi:hypothetical protein